MIGGTCAACGRPGHRFGTTHGPDAPNRWDPVACINGLLGEVEALRGAIAQHREERGAPRRSDGGYAGFPEDERLWSVLDGGGS